MLEEKLLNKYKEILGTSNLIIQEDELNSVEQATYQTKEKVVAILIPQSIDILKLCLQVSNENNIAIYPISKGKNWGYGSKVPLQTNSIIIDLSRLNNVIDYNEELGYVTVEPGVTFQQLFEYLRKKESNLIISATGSSKESSLIGNAVDRGIGTGLYADRFSHICNIEVILSNGNTFNTGFGKYGNTTVANVYRWGIGPALDGLFSQSNFGIITKMTMWLMPIPDYLTLVFYKINDTKMLPNIIDTLRKLSLNGLIRPTFTIYNDLRVLSTISQYPFDSFSPYDTPIPSVVKLLKEKIGINDAIGSWNGEISIRAMSIEHSKIQFELIKNAIQGKVDDIDLVEVSKKEMIDTLNSYYTGNYKSSSNNLKNFLLGKYIGIPNDIALKQTYWRKKGQIPLDMNPDKDKCGIIWICPIVPFTKEDIELSIKIIEDTIVKFFFEPSISLQFTSERAVNIIASISWDREIAMDDKNAIICYKEVNSLLNEKGYFAYRNTTLGMKIEETKYDDGIYNEVIKKIKNVFDPNNIIAPGRYVR